MSLTINMRAAINSLNRLANHPLTAWLKTVAVRERAVVGRRIMVEKREPDGPRWAPWSDRTAEYRSQKGTAGLGILRDEGALLASLVYASDHDSVVIGTNIVYGKQLQEGGPGLPARPFLGWSNISIAKYEQEAARSLERIV